MTNLAYAVPTLEPTEESAHNLHEGIIPGGVLPDDGITADITTTTPDRRVLTGFRVFRISPMGVELLLPKGMNESMALLAPGVRVDLQVKMHDHVSRFSGLSVSIYQATEKGTVIGFRWCSPESESNGEPTSQTNRRAAVRWMCGLDFLPTGIAPNPARFNDFIHFRVFDLSLKGMLWVTSLRNRYIIPGMSLESIVSFPMSSQVQIKATITNARVIQVQGTPYLALGMKIEKTDRQFAQIVGQYVFQFGPKSTIDKLKQEGLPVPKASQAVEFGFVRNEEEYKEVLELRLTAYKHVGKLPETATTADTSDIYDARSRIVIARHRGEIVASMRIMSHDPADPFEFQEHAKVPGDFPEKHECVEVSRLCVHPSFRQSDVFYNMLRHLAVITIQSKRRYICAFAADDILPLYKKVGAKMTGVRFMHPQLGKKENEVVVWDIVKAVSGVTLNPFVWNYMCQDLVEYLDSANLVKFHPLMNLRMAIYRLFGPLTPMVLGRLRTAAAAKKK